mgnify:FL=1
MPFDFGDANERQIEAIQSTSGPVLITAGPGTGKTFTLVQRAIYLIQECGIKPEEIFIATFTEKAAKELVTRITNELAARDISVNVNEMYVGTFHSICLRIIKEHLEYSRLKKNYRMLDSFDQQYMVFQNLNRFKRIANLDGVIKSKGWRMAKEICEYANNLSEEMVTPEALRQDKDRFVVALGNMLAEYQMLLNEGNLIDFSTIQTECFRILKENPAILDELQEKIKYIMVDEYQDTNYIQEQIVFLLGKTHNNICVVGDDDQGLYRFRGATIRNILEFPTKFSKDECKIVALTENYRSDSDIVDFYNKWMATTDGSNFRFDWDRYRYEKRIIPHEQSKVKSPCVVKLSSKDDPDEWHQRVLGFIHELKDSGKLTDYNQLAFLFNSVKHPRVTALSEFLEKNGINVYSPRSDMFFKREEVMLALGCIMLMFPRYVHGLENMEYQYLQTEHYSYYRQCILAANELLKKEENKELRSFIKGRGKEHFSINDTLDYAYTGLIYMLFAFQPFSSLLDIEMSSGVVDVRPSRNLAQITQIIGKFECLHRINVLDGRLYNNERRIDADTNLLFNLYLRLLIDGGIDEYEDDSEYAPSGCVSFLTIHQSKGMEFPIVFVDSLSNVPRKTYKELMTAIEDRYFHRPAYEPYEQMKFFDFWRLYYTAFSRAQDLLVLTCDETKKCPSSYFKDLYDELPSVSNDEFKISEFDFKTVKAVNIKETFSFTSHISVYETCALQYKFYKELEFLPVRGSAQVFGTLVHETIEDIHKAAIRNEEHLITRDNIENWFESNYTSLVKSQHSYLARPQLDAAFNQVLRYVDRQNGNWSLIKQAEVDVSLVQPDYIIEGTIDLVKGEGDTVELIDFKSEHKPDLEKMRDRIEQYRRQLHIYAYLIEHRTGQKVSKMHLYYTGEEDGNPMITFPYTKSAIEGTVAAFDDTVHKIMKKDFRRRCDNPTTCRDCDFRHYCGNK